MSSPSTTAFCLAQAGGGAATGGSPLGSLLLMAALFGLMYFLFIRPQKRRQMQIQEMLSKLKVGDRVMTSGGMLGTISKVSDKTVRIVLADKVEIEFVRSAVADIIKDPEAETNENAEQADKPASSK
ncbi:MAG: preprotein translocase subunit YajC [Oligosphaeraceae bacterium]|nr:preprotein translocase subunit YajC [Oligosphaeraceae bacterium]